MFRLCSKTDRDLAGCVKKSIDLIRPKLKSGQLADDLKIEGLEPIVIDNILVQRAGLDAKLTKLKSYGASDFIIEKTRINIENPKFDFIVTVPKIKTYGKYKLQMSLGVINVKGQGNVTANIGNENLLKVEGKT